MAKFNNYQLYKTSVLLGGQMKYDLVLNSDHNQTYVSNFHISPISEYVPFNRHNDRNLLAYPHQYNIRDFYKETVSSFYENFTEPQMNHNWPIVDDSKIYDDTFYSGCSRMKYDVYKKQFEFLCPVWLEKLSGNFLAFDIKVKTKRTYCSIASKTIVIKPNGMPQHDKFANYMNDYFKYIGVDNGCNDVMNINFFKKTAHLRGVDLESGNLVTRDLFDLPNNLMGRERPLLEFDYLITSSYMDTKTIVPNLFNFNLCFNIEDIFTTNILHLLHGQRIIIGVDVRIVDSNYNTVEKLEKRDIYTNYEYIPKKFCNPISSIHSRQRDYSTYSYTTNEPNVLDYINDDKFVANIDKNKIVQKIPHWQLNDNDSYLFNLYEGFRGYLGEKVGIIVGQDPDYTYISEQPVSGETWLITKGKGRVERDVLIMDEGIKMVECYNRYADTPDILQTKYSRSLNNVGWARCVHLGCSDIYVLRNNPGLVDKITSTMDKGWNGYLYYDLNDEVFSPIRLVLGFCDKPEEYGDLKKLISEESEIIEYNDLFFAWLKGISQKTLLICSKDIDKLTFASFKLFLKDNIKETSEPSDKSVTNDIINNLYKLLNSVRPLPLVTINNRLGIMLADSPDSKSQEVDYKKINTNMVYVLRYDGKIKPNMVPVDGGFKNYIYNKKKLFDLKSGNNPFMNYTESGYPPIYPSIGYWVYEKQYLNYKIPPKYVDQQEYKWFDNSKVLYTKPELTFHISTDSNTKASINEEIKHQLSLDTEIKDDDTLSYILNLYNIYYNLTDNIGNKYNYYIHMTFK